jgi:small subunit ribosomal protein S5
MADETTVVEGVVEDAIVDAPVVDAAAPADKARADFRTPRGRRPGGREGRPPRRGTERPRSEFDQKIITIRRVARVMAGGRRFNFSVAVVIGNKKGKVGVGLGKAGDTTLAIDKAVRDAKKHLHTLTIRKDGSIAHDVQAKYAASVIALNPAPRRGLVAGGSVRTVLELAGVSNVTAKILSRSKNHLNNARATVKALQMLKA